MQKLKEIRDTINFFLNIKKLFKQNQRLTTLLITNQLKINSLFDN